MELENFLRLGLILKFVLFKIKFIVKECEWKVKFFLIIKSKRCVLFISI